MENIEEVKDYLYKKRNSLEEEIEICKDKIKVINNSFNNEGFCDLESLNDGFDLIEKYGYVEFVRSKFTKKEIEDRIYRISQKKGFLNKTLKKGLEKGLSQVKMNGNKFEDFESYKTLVENLYNMLKYFEKINSKKSSPKHKFGLLYKEYSDSIYNSLRGIIAFLYIDFRKVLEKLLKNLSNKSVKYSSLISILNDLTIMDINEKPEEYEKLVNTYSKIIRNNPFLQEPELENLNLYLRSIVKSYNTAKKKQEIGNNVSDDVKIIKFGSREERKEDYKKAKEKEGLEKTIEDLRGKLDEESTLWLDITLEQLISYDKDAVNEFLKNPGSYVPSDDPIMIETIIKELEFRDLDQEGVSLNKKIISGLERIKRR